MTITYWSDAKERKRYCRLKCLKFFKLDEVISSHTSHEREVKRMEIDKVSLLILSILQESNATRPGTGMTLREIANEVNQSADRTYALITVSRKVWAMRDMGYVTSKLKTNKADMFYISAKGKEIREVLLSEE